MIKSNNYRQAKAFVKFNILRIAEKQEISTAIDGIKLVTVARSLTKMNSFRVGDAH